MGFRISDIVGQKWAARPRRAAPLLLVPAAQHAFAADDDDYPKRQIKIIVPFPGGAGPDQAPACSGSTCRTRSASRW